MVLLFTAGDCVVMLMKKGGVGRRAGEVLS